MKGVTGFEQWDVNVHYQLGCRITREGFLLRVLVGGVSYADVLELAREWRPVGNTLLRLSSFYGHYPQLASASVICTVVVYQMHMTCLSYNKTISTNTVYQGLETELNHMMKLVDHG